MTTAESFCHTSQEVCGDGLPDIFDLQETAVLTLAFILGWFLFRLIFQLLPALSRAAKLKGTDGMGRCEMRPLTGAEPEVTSTKACEETKGDVLPRLLAPRQGNAAVLDQTSARQIHSSCEECKVLIESSSDPLPGQESHLALARDRARHQDILGSANCIEAVRRAGGRVDQRTLRFFVTACAKGGMMDKAIACFQSALLEGLAPDFQSYSALVRGLCAAGQLDQATYFFYMMLEKGHRPDGLLADALLECCVSQSHLPLVEKVIAVMEDFELRPSNSTLAAHIRLCFARGELHQALQMFKEMPKQFGFTPNAYVHGVLISTCYSFGQCDSALQVHQSMLSCGCRPDSRTYECLIRCCFAVGHLSQAVALVDEALALRGGAVPARRTFIDARAVEDLLATLCRRGEALRLGLPLVKRLQASNFEISEATVAATARAAEAAPCERKQRRVEFQHWRDFGASDRGQRGP
mmetsp:Transcript_110646/g.263778  ORF Transcript_110646/g.263778 Transcript_110646/m.263778 type:complete len:467 (+) Transcript_110646:148-1548(+)